jgi:AcrR family transcriptional regulator
MAQRTLPDLPIPPEIPEPEPLIARRSWGKISYEDRFRRQRRALLDVAARLAAERGMGGTSVASIASDAGVSKRVFYEHFANKEACFVELLRELGAEILRRGVAAAHASDGRTLHDVILQTIRAVVRSDADPRLVAVFLSEAGAHPELVDEITRHRRSIAELFAALALRLGSPLPASTLRLAAMLLVHGVTALPSEFERNPGARLRELATVCCLAFGLSAD